MSGPALLGGEARLALKRLLSLEAPPESRWEARDASGLLPDGARWETVLRGLEAHGLAPWAHEALGDAGLRTASPAWVTARLREQYRATALRNRILLEALGEIADACATSDIDLVPFKGAALARRLYRDPGLRPMHDLDVLVRPADLDAAGALLRRLGYAVPALVDEAAARREHFHCVYQRPGSAVTVELHWSLGEAADLPPASLAGLWERSAPGPGPGLRMLDAGSELAAVALHAWRHGVLNPAIVGEERLRPLLFEPLSGNRLIWLLDVHRLMRRGEADPGVCRARALEWGAGPALQGAIALAAEAFGPVPGWDPATDPRERGVSLAHYLVVRRLGRGLAAGSPGTARLLRRLSRMDLRLQARPIRVLDLLDRFRAPAPLRRLRERHGAAVLPACWIGAGLAGAGALARAAAMVIRSRLPRRR